VTARLAPFLLLAVVSVAAPALAQDDRRLGPDGVRALQMARTADDAALGARNEGEALLVEVQRLDATGPEEERLAALQAEAKSAHQALLGYRRLAQMSATEALQLLADASRRPAGQSDPVRRDVVEQRALLAAHEAAVMAARARTETERLRALHAEVRALLAARRPPERPPAGVPAAGPPPRAPAAGEVTVPNLVGARLDAATRDLAEAGLALGETTGPREGFVVKQRPEAGASVPRQTAIGVTLSATAAGVTVPASP